MINAVVRGKEHALQDRAKKWINSRAGWWCYRATPPPVGVPDLLCCYRGKFVGIEVKTPKNPKPTPIQFYTHEEIRDCDGIAFVAVGWDGIKKVVESIET